MSRIYQPGEWERLTAERAAAARKGRIDTHAIGQAGLTQEWQAPEGWTPPVVETKPGADSPLASLSSYDIEQRVQKDREMGTACDGPSRRQRH